MQSGWAVVMTQPNAERKAVLNLQRQGFETYFPRFREKIVVNGKPSIKIGALFARYVFVFIESTWRSILGTFGVTGIIRNGESPVVLDRAVIDELKAREDSTGFVDLTTKVQFKRIGEAVKVNTGPFSGQQGIYQGQSAKDREIVLLDLLGRKVKVELDREQIA